MTGILHVPDEHGFKTTHDIKQEFKMNVKSGLEKTNKQIQSKYLYDEHGCEFFNRITRHPDYYLTHCELEILNANKKYISQLIGVEPFNLVELGPGEGIKPQILMQQFLQDTLNFTYIPIDISLKYLKILVNQFKHLLPELDSTAIHSDFFKGLEWLSMHSTRRNFVLFLGSSIGNFDPAATQEFFQHLWGALHDGDFVLIGFDLCKNIDVLLRAYNDNEGITRDFNLNLLQRINHELNANFALEKFRHYATYNVHAGAMESYLVSLQQQVVNIDALGQSFAFDEVEPIHVEFSYKYHLAQIEKFASMHGFKIIETFTDSRHYFIDTLWQVNK